MNYFTELNIKSKISKRIFDKVDNINDPEWIHYLEQTIYLLNIEDFRDNKDLKSLKVDIVKFRDDKPGKIIPEKHMINKNFIELQKPIKKFIDLTINLKALKHKINAIFDSRVAELEEEFERYKYEYHTFDSFEYVD